MTRTYGMALAAASVFALAPTLGFAQEQEGLVNVGVNVEDNVVVAQVPVEVAAQVCDVDVSVITTEFVGTEETVCEIDQETAAENDIEYEQ